MADVHRPLHVLDARGNLALCLLTGLQVQFVSSHLCSLCEISDRLDPYCASLMGYIFSVSAVCLSRAIVAEPIFGVAFSPCC